MQFNILGYVILFSIAIISVLSSALFVTCERNGNLKEDNKQMMNFIENNNAQNDKILKHFFRSDSLVSAIAKEHGVKERNVETITKINFRDSWRFKDTLIVRNNDTTRCINVKHKDVTISGCDGNYVFKRDFSAVGFVHKEKQKGFFGFLKRKEEKLDAWTPYGDTLDIKLISRKRKR